MKILMLKTSINYEVLNLGFHSILNIQSKSFWKTSKLAWLILLPKIIWHQVKYFSFKSKVYVTLRQGHSRSET